MKALTLTQPWATLVAIGAKQFETRGWSTRYRGPLAIHAAKGFPRWARELADSEAFQWALQGRPLPTGAVVAVGDLLRCTPTVDPWLAQELLLRGRQSQEYGFGDFSLGRWAWELRLVRALAEPVPARGALGLWEWEQSGGGP